MKIVLPEDGNLHTWHITLQGPEGSVYQGGKFGIVLSLPNDYPFKAPDVRFVTRIYHPNIANDENGSICLAMLKPDVWKPASKLRAVFEAIRSLLVEPQPDDPIEARIADEYRQHRDAFNKNAQTYVDKYAKGNISFSARSS